MSHPVELAVSSQAKQLYANSEVIDLHLDSFIWTRIFGYDLHRRNHEGLHPLVSKVLGPRFCGQTDFPRAIDAGFTGGIWVITTNPFKPRILRERAFEKNLPALKALMAGYDAKEGIEFVRTEADYRAARSAGRHGAFIGVQGGNALSLSSLERHARDISRITLVHLTDSDLGTTSAPSPLRRNKAPLSKFGHEYIEVMNANKVLVDLAHISREGFDMAVAAHDPSIPFVVTHTGVAGVYEHWRNLTDKQVRAVADSGGVIGVMFQKSFLGKRNVGVRTVVDHLEHIIDLVGPDVPAIGSDYDGAISPPKGLETPAYLPRVVDEMLRRNIPHTTIEKTLAENFLRVVKTVRG